ncbi:MAG: hypothetical protein KJ064_24475 [Anaerolineae bacterium]|nr:hypothetical protein [Anaerolineae bacterium]
MKQWLSVLVIPPEVTIVTGRAHDLVDGFGGQDIVVDLPPPTVRVIG